MHRIGPLNVLLCLGLVFVMLCFGSCSRKESFSPYLTGGLGVDTLFDFAAIRGDESDWSNRGRSAADSWASQRMVVCSWEGYWARCFLRFSALPDSLVEVTSASLYLYATRVAGDAAGNAFEVYTLADSLNQLNLFWGNMPNHSPVPAAMFFPPTQSGDSIQVDVTEVVASWVNRLAPNLGFTILSAEEASADAGVIAEFATHEALPREVISDDTLIYDFRPALRIAYVDTAGQDQLAISIAGVDAFADTLVTPLEHDSPTLVCGNGFPSRFFVKFDVSGIPREATVTRSVLKLTPDLEQSSFDSLGIICHAVLDEEWQGFDTKFGLSGTGSTVLKAEDLSPGETIAMAITPLVQPLVSRQQSNYGFLVKSSSEGADLDFIRFFSTASTDTNTRPILEVYYVLPMSPPYGRE